MLVECLYGITEEYERSKCGIFKALFEIVTRNCNKNRYIILIYFEYLIIALNDQLISFKSLKDNKL